MGGINLTQVGGSVQFHNTMKPGIATGFARPPELDQEGSANYKFFLEERSMAISTAGKWSERIHKAARENFDTEMGWVVGGTEEYDSLLKEIMDKEVSDEQKEYLVKELQSVFRNVMENMWGEKIGVPMMRMYQLERNQSYDKTQEEMKYLRGFSNDIRNMVKNTLKHYQNNGGVAELTNEIISKNTTMIEYNDIAILEAMKKNLDKIREEMEDEYGSQLQGHDKALEKIYQSELSDKAKKTLGEYIKEKKDTILQSIDDEVILSKEDSNQLKNINKEYNELRNTLIKNQEQSLDNQDVFEQFLAISKQITEIYLKYLIN